MKINSLKVIGLLVGLVIVFTLAPQSSATVVWSDDFSSVVLVDWNVTDGNWQIDVDDYLENVQDTGYHCRVWHTSSQVTGTWSIDVCLLTNDVDILFMANGTDPPGDYVGYGLRLTGDFLVLIKQNGTYDLVETLTSFMIGDHEGTWTSFDITRNSTGEVNVYVNASSAVAEPVLSFVDTEFNYSERLVLYCRLGHARFDNIVVDDEILITPLTTPTTTTTPPDTSPTNGGTSPPPMDNTLLLVGAGIAGICILAAIVVLRRR